MPLTQRLPEIPLLQDRTIIDRNGRAHQVMLANDQLRRTLVEMRKTILQLQGSNAPIGLPSNLKVTAEAFGNLIQWSRGLNADFHEVLWNTVPTVNTANVVPVQNAAQWFDNVGQSAIKRYYWVRAVKQVALHAVTRTVEVGPVAGTTLASGTGVAPPIPPPAGVTRVKNLRTGGLEPL